MAKHLNALANQPKAQEQKPKQGQGGKGKPQTPKKGTILTQHTGLPPRSQGKPKPKPR